MADDRKKRPPSRPADSEDALTERALVASAWLQDNARMLIAGAVVLTVAVVGVLWYQSYRADLHESAAVEFMQLEPMVQTGDPGAIPSLEEYVDRYDGTPYAREARVMLARLYLVNDQPEEAVRELDEIGRRPRRSAFDAQIELLHGDALSEANQLEEAIERYLRVADDGPHRYLRIQGLESAALLRSEAGDHAGAAELYGRMSEEHPEGSREREQAEMRRIEAEQRARTSP